MPVGEAACRGRKAGPLLDDEPDRLESAAASCEKQGKQRKQKRPAGHGGDPGREQERERGGKLRLTP
jgi:hypothetical protein